ncbi:MAG: hypothetical protein Q9164_005959 [Protoblastenia rupestris]
MPPSKAAIRKQADEPASSAHKPTSRPNTKVRKLNHGPEKVLSAPGRKAPSQQASKAKSGTAKVVLSRAPDKTLNVYVFGVNDQGELSLAAGTPPGHIATDGMHCAALTYDNRILTWGINDLGALGRDTEWGDGWVDMDENKSDADSDDPETAVNPKEATPTAVKTSLFPPGTEFMGLAAGDNATFAFTRNGLVYGWGTFKVSASS